MRNNMMESAKAPKKKGADEEKPPTEAEAAAEDQARNRPNWAWYRGGENATTAEDTTREGEGRSETEEEVRSVAMVVVILLVAAMLVV